MRGAVVIGGERPARGEAVEHLRECDIVVAADSGVYACIEWGIEPTHIVGDMDSVADTSVFDRFPSAKVLRYPGEKDETDTELGLVTAREAGCDVTILLGGGGGRLDHLLALVSLFDRPSPPSLWVTGRDQVHHVTDELALPLPRGATLSVFPVGLGPWKMESTGLKWPLGALEWKRGDIGVSNVTTDSPVMIRVQEGRVIVVRSDVRGGTS